MKQAANPQIFREYDIRGVADTDLNDTAIYPLGRAIGTYLGRSGTTHVTVGRDCRLSSERIQGRLISALLDSGLDVTDIGLVPTPLLYFSVIHLKAGGGIMITGSHNPPEYNGLKVCSGRNTLFGDQIQEIRQILETGTFVSGKGTLRGFSIIDTYIDEISRRIQGPLPIKVVVDSGNGMAGLLAGRLFRKLGCQVTELFSELDGRFPNHHPDPTDPQNMRDLVKAVMEQGAVAGVGFDGDADRIGAVDKTGRILFGDELLVLYARDLLVTHPGATIISEVKASHRLFTDIRSHGGNPIMWKTGHSLIKAKMKETAALLAGEMSGHMFFADRYFGYDDALYAAARLFEILTKTGKTPGELLADLPATVCTPEIRVSCSDETKFKVVEQSRHIFEGRGATVNGIDGARVEFGDGWGLVRASNTQPVLVYRFEANSAERLGEIRKFVEDVVNGQLLQLEY